MAIFVLWFRRERYQGDSIHYSAASGLVRMVLAISFWRSNSARRRAISSDDKSAILEKSSFQAASALHRSGDTSVREAARAYLERFPNGFRRAEVEQLAR